MEPEISSDVLAFCCNKCILTETGTDKNHPGQNLPDKRPLTKSPAQKPPRTIEREFVLEAFVQVFVLDLLKMRCVTYFWGSRVCVTKCDRRRGPKLAKNSVTYFMDGP